MSSTRQLIHSSPYANPHVILGVIHLNAKGAGKKHVHPLRIKSELRDQCQEQGPTAFIARFTPTASYLPSPSPALGHFIAQLDNHGWESTSMAHPTHPFKLIFHSRLSLCSLFRFLHTDTYNSLPDLSLSSAVSFHSLHVFLPPQNYSTC